MEFMGDGINSVYHLQSMPQDEVAIMEFPSSIYEDIVAHRSIPRRDMWWSHQELLTRQTFNHRQQQPNNLTSQPFTSEDEFTSFHRQMIITHHQQQYNHFRNFMPSLLDNVNENIPYEQLLELQERIGNINTGLSEVNITTCLNTRTVSTSGDVNDEEIFNEICIVCQDEYKDHDMIGTLKCGHEYHRDCIKEWLLLKNVCPICKQPALSTATS